MNYEAILSVSVALTHGNILHVNNVTVGNGTLIDWRYVKSGQTFGEGLQMDNFDLAAAFVAMVGTEDAIKAASEPV